MSRLRFVFLLLFVATLAGCASISSSTVKLSAEVGDRMAEMRGLHEASVRAYFEVEERRIDDFMEEKWIPLFLQNFIGTSGILKDLAHNTYFDARARENLTEAMRMYLTDDEEAPEVVDKLIPQIEAARVNEPETVRGILVEYVEDDSLEVAVSHITSLLGTADPGVLIIEWAEAANKEIRQRRRTLLAPLKEQERMVLAELATAYGELAAAQGLVTGRLEAAAKVKGVQDEALRSLGIDDTAAQLKRRLAGVSDAVGGALAKSAKVVSSAPEVDLGGSFDEIRAIFEEELGSAAAPAADDVDHGAAEDQE